MIVGSIFRLMRPGDWFKNVFVLGPLVFALPNALADQQDDLPWGLAGIAVAAFCLLTSGFYCINDALDVESDRGHPRKRTRPVASGAVSVKTALACGGVFSAAGLALGFAASSALGVTLGLYAILQILYNVALKRVLVVDVLAVATGFGLRAAAGAVAIGVQLSMWLLMCVFFLCMFLGFAKRLGNLRSADKNWKSSAGYEDANELHWLLGMSAVLAVMTYLMYTLSPHAREIFGARTFGLALLTPLVIISVHRFYRRATLGRRDSPLAAVMEDRAVLVSLVLFGAGTIASLYVPGAEEALGRVFFLTGLDAGG